MDPLTLYIGSQVIGGVLNYNEKKRQEKESQKITQDLIVASKKRYGIQNKILTEQKAQVWNDLSRVLSQEDMRMLGVESRVRAIQASSGVSGVSSEKARRAVATSSAFDRGEQTHQASVRDVDISRKMIMNKIELEDNIQRAKNQEISYPNALRDSLISFGTNVVSAYGQTYSSDLRDNTNYTTDYTTLNDPDYSSGGRFEDIELY